MKFLSTRGRDQALSSQEAVLGGLARDGGLYVPEALVQIDRDRVRGRSYAEVAAYVMGLVINDFSQEDLNTMAQEAYDRRFFKENALGLVTLGDRTVMELFHGPTAAFKDFALTILPQLMSGSMEEEEVIILTATSGDTGKAALEGFKDVEGTSVFVYYPTDGVSNMQKLQMMTQTGSNTHAIAIEGNFDQAQRGVKTIFSDPVMESWAQGRGARLSSANSINIGRLVPQIVYYAYAYEALVSSGQVEDGEGINVSVPTGNFGDILGAYYARLIGVPIKRLICASNANRVLADFFKTGVYDSKRDLVATQSPSMDILVSSNLERLLYHLAGADRVRVWMDQLETQGSFDVGPEVLEDLAVFKGYWGTDEEGREVIKKVFNQEGYLMDTHTAMAWKAHEDYLEETGDQAHTLVVATASPYKFPEAVGQALGLDKDLEGQALLEDLARVSGTPIPQPLRGLWDLPISQDLVIAPEDMARSVRDGFDG